MLWNKNFTLLAAANVFFHAAVYMQFPVLHRWMTDVWGYTGVEAACMAVVFGLSLFIPGVFNSYLVDTFSRKQVCIRSMIVLALATLAYPWTSATWQIVALRVLQGSAFGIALMATGSTLAIDVAPSHQRDGANRAFTWSGIAGMLAGVVIGLAGMQHVAFTQLVSASACLLAVAMVLIGYVKISLFAFVFVRPFPAFPCGPSGHQYDGGSVGDRHAFCFGFRFFLLSLHRAWLPALSVGEGERKAAGRRADSSRGGAIADDCRTDGIASS